jgi:N-acetylglucosamine kinase-like BadF-type ATPase
MTKKTPKPANKRLAMGVDRGGTHTRIALINDRGTELKRAVYATAHIRNLTKMIVKTAAIWGLDSRVPVIIATRGAITRKWKKPFLLKKLKDRINLLDVISDAQAAYLAAHGSQTGALLIAGTGAVVFLKLRNGRFKKIGGLLPAGGDPGSGLWIGTRFLKTIKVKKNGLPPRARAAYAAKAVQEAERGDIAAIELIHKAHEHLSCLLAKALKKRTAGKPLKVALTGGLMRSAFFKKNFIAAARGHFASARLVFTGLKRPAENAAAELAMKINARNKNA